MADRIPTADAMMTRSTSALLTVELLDMVTGRRVELVHGPRSTDIRRSLDVVSSVRWTGRG